jgi:ABC-type lipoprotein release transport system permease subunit
MKCLGALDRFVLRLFLLEAGMQGLSGAGVGALAGGIFALISAFFRFGFPVIETMNWMNVVVSIMSSVGVGCVLSLVGVLYPAVVAARMQPVEAMRVEH